MTRTVRFLAAAAIGAVLCAGCREGDSQAASPDRPELLVFCGAGLRPPMEELVREFSAAEEVDFVVDYAGSEVLLSKIRLSGQGDLYLPGDKRYVDAAAEQGLVASRRSVSYFVPTILVAKDNPKGIRSLRDLMRPDVRLGLGDPRAVAIGAVSRHVLANSGVAWDKVEEVLRFQAVTVNELAVHVQSGSLDAAIVWDAVAKQYARHTDEVPIPLDQNIVSVVEMAVLTSSGHPALAERFLEFASSGLARDIFRRHGYRVDEPGEPAGDRN